MPFFERVYEITRQIPLGKVATYGQIARLSGNPRMSRQVGWALHQNPEPGEIPCHRVLNRFGMPSGSFAFGGEGEQLRLLAAEGVDVTLGRVDLHEHLWVPEPELLFR